MDRSFCDWCGEEIRDERSRWLKSWVAVYDRSTDALDSAYKYSYGTEKHELCQDCLARAQTAVRQARSECSKPEVEVKFIDIGNPPRPEPPPEPEQRCWCWLHRLANRLCGGGR